MHCATTHVRGDASGGTADYGRNRSPPLPRLQNPSTLCGVMGVGFGVKCSWEPTRET